MPWHEKPTPYFSPRSIEGQPKAYRRPARTVEMRVRKDHSAMDQEPGLVAETLLP
jgi:hypothetical protein